VDHGWQPNYQRNRRSMRKYSFETTERQDAVLYQNDDYGKDYLKGLQGRLGAKAASMIVNRGELRGSEPTIDPHIVKMKATGATVFSHHHAEIRGAGDQKTPRSAGSPCLPQQRFSGRSAA